MSLLLYFLAFPGVPIMIFIRGRRATRRYIASLHPLPVFTPPTVEEVLSRGFLGTYRRIASSRDETDARVRAGDYGPEVRALLADEQRQLRISYLAPFIGLILVAIVASVVPTASHALGTSDDAVAAALLSLSVWVIIAIRAIRLTGSPGKRWNSRRLTIAYGIGLAIVTVVGALFVARIFGGQ